MRSDDTLWCWGEGFRGRLGLGDDSDGSTPHQVDSDTDWNSVAASNAFSCGVANDGTLWCWGLNDVGQLGLGDDSNRLLPDQVESDAD